MSDEISLGDALRAHYAHATLRPEALARMRVMARTHPRARLPSRRALWTTIACGAIAIGVLMTGLLLPYVSKPATSVLTRARATAVLSAVDALHCAATEPEIRTGTIESLAYLSDSLGFEPRVPLRLTGLGHRLVGATELSLLGSPSLALLFTGPDGKRVTLVETLGIRVPVSDRREIFDDAHVSLWHEDVLLLVLARPVR